MQVKGENNDVNVKRLPKKPVRLTASVLHPSARMTISSIAIDLYCRSAGVACLPQSSSTLILASAVQVVPFATHGAPRM